MYGKPQLLQLAVSFKPDPSKNVYATSAKEWFDRTNMNAFEAFCPATTIIYTRPKSSPRYLFPILRRIRMVKTKELQRRTKERKSCSQRWLSHRLGAKNAARVMESSQGLWVGPGLIWGKVHKIWQSLDTFSGTKGACEFPINSLRERVSWPTLILLSAFLATGNRKRRQRSDSRR